jgi:TPR repeat protein/Holliday junction resolvasome RuvABC ATP-dependent DNA helicase subunit
MKEIIKPGAANEDGHTVKMLTDEFDTLIAAEATPFETKWRKAQEAAALDYGPAIVWLAEKKAVGSVQPPMEPDPVGALDIIKAAAKKNHPYVLYYYGKAMIEEKTKHKFIPANFAEGIKLLEKASALGSPEGAFELGIVHIYNSTYPQRSVARGYNYFRLAQERGHPTAEWELGYCNYWGDGCEKNVMEALRIFRKFSNLRYYRAYLDLARVLIDNIIPDTRNTRGEEIAYQNEAYNNLYKLADHIKTWDKVDKYYQYHRLLGICYLRGYGVEINEGVAMQNLEIAAQGNLQGAKSLLDNYYRTNFRHPDQAVKNAVGWAEPRLVFDDIVGYAQEMSAIAMRRNRGGFMPHLHLVGKDGTGKRMFTRIVASKLVQMGVLHKAGINEVNLVNLSQVYRPSDIDYELSRMWPNWKNGVMVIYSDYTPTGGKEMIAERMIADWLSKMAEDENTLLVMYDNQNGDMLRRLGGYSPNLISQFRFSVPFQDYTAPEMLEILRRQARETGIEVHPDAESKLLAVIAKRMSRGIEKQQNVYLVDKLLQECLVNRVGVQAIDPHGDLDFVTQDDAAPAPAANTPAPVEPPSPLVPLPITAACVPEEKTRTEEISTLIQPLNDLVGLGVVKDQIQELISLLQLNKMRREKKLPEAYVSLHSVFLGNPGTGKTTVARLLGRVFSGLGYLESGHVVEVSRGDLVGEYIGTTAPRVLDAVNRAEGGVRFFDEAYALVRSDSGRDYGFEAIDTLLKLMEDRRDRFVVIAAGYEKEMQDFLSVNTGLKSRFSRFITFPDYTVPELLQMMDGIAARHAYQVSDDAKEEIARFVDQLDDKGKTAFGNGRGVRTVFERTVAKQARRIIAASATAEDSTLITASDIWLPDDLITGPKMGFARARDED